MCYIVKAEVGSSGDAIENLGTEFLEERYRAEAEKNQAAIDEDCGERYGDEVGQ